MDNDTGQKQTRRRALTQSSPGGEASPSSKSGGQRAAKLMARAGLCSRREAEAWIAEGRVALNGAALKNPAVNVTQDDKITVDGKPLAPRTRTRLFLFHKPRGLVTTARDPQGRRTIFDHLREHWPEGPRVVSVGRLDINSEGLLLLTNDGGLARILELPATGWLRRYRVRAKGQTTQAILDKLRDGATIAGMTYAGIEATLDRPQGANCWLTMALREGKNREIKRVLESVGLMVNRLIRISYGPFQLGDLGLGEVEEVRTRVLRDQLGPALATSAGVDFSSRLYGTNAPEEAATNSVRRGLICNAPKPRSGPRALDPPPVAEPNPPPRRRKHISALRSERDEGPKTRNRIAHGKTEDRAGRVVPVERLISALSKEETRGQRGAKKSAKIVAGSLRGAKHGGREKSVSPGRTESAFGNRPGPRTGGPKSRRPRRKS